MTDRVNSIDLDLLHAHLVSNGRATSELHREAERLSELTGGVVGRSADHYWAGTGVDSVRKVLGLWEANGEAARAVHDSLAETQSGVATVLESVIGGILTAGGHHRAPQIAPFQQGEAHGLDPRSGFADDPVSTYRGNFVHVERETATGGLGALIDASRVYNSLRGGEPGLFGDGWSSLLDMRLDDLGPSGVRVLLADGAEAFFIADDSGGYRPSIRRLLRLGRRSDLDDRPDQGGDATFVLGEADTHQYHFSAAGTLVGGVFGSVGFTMTRESDAVVVGQPATGRSVTYAINGDGLVSEVRTSAGQRTSYAYDGRRCVRASGQAGRFEYEYRDGLLVCRRDADGVAAFVNTYDAQGRVLAQRAPHGAVSTFDYLDDGTTRVSYGDGGPVNLYVHDDRARLTAMYGADGRALRTTYDEHDRVVRSVDRTGLVTTYGYGADPMNDLWTVRTRGDEPGEERQFDERRRCTRHLDASGGERRFDYEADNRSPSVVTNPVGGRTVTTFDAAGLEVTRTDPDGFRTAVERNGDGLVVRLVDAAHRQTSLRYDDHGRLVESMGPDGRRVTMDLAEDGQIIELADDLGNHLEIDYTPGRRIASVTANGQLMWRADYGEHGDARRLTNAIGDHVDLTYDTMGNCVAQIGSSGEVTRFDYDQLGQMVGATTAAGHRIERSVDVVAGTVRTVDAGGASCTYRVDPLGRIVERSISGGPEVRYHHHPSGLIDRQETDDGAVVVEYDLAGRPVTEIDQAGGRRHRQFSPAGRLLAEISPAGRRLAFGYDDAGHLVSIVDGDGQNVMPRDGSWRSPTLVEAALEVPTVLELMRWDASGDRPVFGEGLVSLLVDAGDRHGVDQPGLQRDERGVITSAVDRSGMTTAFVADFYGRPTEIETGGATKRISYDRTESVASLTDPLGQTLSVQRSPTGHVIELDVPDGDPVSYLYGQGNRWIGVAEGGARLVDFRYDDSGRLVEAETTDGAVAVRYDDLGLIRTVTDLDGRPVGYEHDADGLTTARITSDGTSMSYERSAAGRITAIIDPDGNRRVAPGPITDRSELDGNGRLVVDPDGRRFTYDVAGRLATAAGTRGIWEFGYNDLGLLSTERSPEGELVYHYNEAAQLVAVDTERGTTEFSYDARGRRTAARRPDGSSASYRWNGLDQLVEIATTTAEGTVHRRKLSYSGLGRVERVDDTTIGWDDAMTGKPVSIGSELVLRSGLAITRIGDPDADWSEGTFDDPWGDDGGTGIRFGYRTELAVDDLVFMGQRIYHPSTRTFLSVDPLPPLPGSTAFVSPYVYALNDPVNRVDPLGRRALSLEEFAEVKARLETSRFQSLAKKTLIYGGIALAAVTFPVWAPFVVSAAVVLFKAIVVLKLASIAADLIGLEHEWNQFYTGVVAKPLLSGLQWGREQYGQLKEDHQWFFGPAESLGPRGDPGGTFESEDRRPFLVGGGSPLERGLSTVTTAFDHTMDNNQIRADEFEIVDHGNGSYTVILPGVTDLSEAGAGRNWRDGSVRDTDASAALSFGSGDASDNEYAMYVRAAMEEFGVPHGADIMLVGHSYGSDTALDLAMDGDFTETYNLTHVVAAAYDSEKQLDLGKSIDHEVEVLVLKNKNDRVVTVEELAGKLLAEPEWGVGTEHAIVRNFDGKTEDYGHHPNNYSHYLRTTEDRQVRAFLESVGQAGYGDSGRSYAVDISHAGVDLADAR